LQETAERAAAGEGRARAFGWLRIVLTGGGRFILLRDSMSPTEVGRPATAVILPWRRDASDPLVGVKTLSWAGNALGLDRARRAGADEGLWLNRRGHLAEGCTSNLFLVQGRRLLTPAVREGVRPGVVRELVLRAARQGRWTVHEGKVRPLRLQRASEAFLTSSLRGLRPLLAVDGLPIGSGSPGPATRALAVEVARLRGIADPLPLDSRGLGREVSHGGEGS
jgi:branched-subunit amino acid aminotransferase/4-amino-4-deoxychorismate lyase